MENIKWKFIFINGEKTHYMVSNTGLVKRVAYTESHRDGKKYHYPERKVALIETPQHYLRVSLHHNNKIYHKRVNRLVALSFLDNPKHCSDVDHIDGDRKNNNITNLRWLSHAENAHLANHHKRTNYCKDCGCEISSTASYCIKCNMIRKNFGSRAKFHLYINELQHLLYKHHGNFRQVSRILNKTDSGLHKLLRSNGYPYKSKDYKNHLGLNPSEPV